MSLMPCDNTSDVNIPIINKLDDDTYTFLKLLNSLDNNLIFEIASYDINILDCIILDTKHNNIMHKDLINKDIHLRFVLYLFKLLKKNINIFNKIKFQYEFMQLYFIQNNLENLELIKNPIGQIIQIKEQYNNILNLIPEYKNINIDNKISLNDDEIKQIKNYKIKYSYRDEEYIFCFIDKNISMIDVIGNKFFKHNCADYNLSKIISYHNKSIDVNKSHNFVFKHLLCNNDIIKQITKLEYHSEKCITSLPNIIKELAIGRVYNDTLEFLPEGLQILEIPLYIKNIKNLPESVEEIWFDEKWYYYYYSTINLNKKYYSKIYFYE